MNKQHITKILHTKGINMYQIYDTKKLRHFQYFNPYTSELVSFDVHIVPQKNHYDLYVTNVQELVDSCVMVPHHQNHIKQFRSFILATLIRGFDDRLVLCKNQFAAHTYKNFGGNVICIKNNKGGKIWAVIRKD